MQPPTATLEWAASQLGPGSEIVSIDPLPGGRWHVSHVLHIAGSGGATYDLILRRWARPGWDQLDPDFDAAREASVLQLLERTPVPAPMLVAADPDPRWCDAPTLLITRLAGGSPPSPTDLDGYLQQLAHALAAIHAVDDSDARRLPAYRPWTDVATIDVPEWAATSEPWRHVFDTVRTAPPRSAYAFIHRDYHPGNTLWIGERLTGIVDWSTGSWGPISVDLAHMRWNLALELGPQAPDRFLAAYRRATGRRIEHSPYWDMVEVADAFGAGADRPPAELEAYLQLLART